MVATDRQFPTVRMVARPSIAQRELFPRMLTRADLGNVEAASTALEKMLGLQGLQAVTRALAIEGPRFRDALVSYAILADSALSALDYRVTGNGWKGWNQFSTKYPASREGYRTRSYRPDLELASNSRRVASQKNLAANLLVALGNEAPVDALEGALVANFLRELNVDPATSAGWNSNVASVACALDRELFVPLRALHDATGKLDHDGVPLGDHTRPELDRRCRAVVEDLIRTVADGTFADWRFSNPLGRAQLSALTPDQEQAFRKPRSVVMASPSKPELRTRNEQGDGLFWLTKIAGPSHGFDMLSQCHLALLANARNNGIVVDVDGRPDAARSVVRVLTTTKNKPLLYLEMLQLCFELPQFSGVERDDYRIPILRHALEMAREMKVPLAIAYSKYENTEQLLKELGVKGRRGELDIHLHPSNGVFEASDSMVGAHHAPQVDARDVHIPPERTMYTLSTPGPALIIEPSEIPDFSAKRR